MVLRSCTNNGQLRSRPKRVRNASASTAKNSANTITIRACGRSFCSKGQGAHEHLLAPIRLAQSDYGALGAWHTLCGLCFGGIMRFDSRTAGLTHVEKPTVINI